MNPKLALLAAFAATAWMIRTDMQVRRSASAALWVPAIWLLILGSRPVGLWLGGGGTQAEGSPIDRWMLIVMIVIGLGALGRRGVSLGIIVSANRAFALLLFYLLMSSFWAYDPLLSLKRWFKVIGSVIFALVILSESNPTEAIRIVYVRCAYFLFPVSVVVSKYFPGVGAVQTRSWNAMIIGLTEHKNMLGQVAMVFGMVLVWDILASRSFRRGQRAHPLRLGHGFTLACGLWLLIMCDSKTSLGCCLLGAALWIFGGRLARGARPGQVLARLLGAGFAVFVLEGGIGVSGLVLDALGRDRTLTGRTEIWSLAKTEGINPIVGCGYYGFWDRPRNGDLQEYQDSGFRTVHNGYLEMYLDGGSIGLALLAGVLLAGLHRGATRLIAGGAWGRYSLMLIIVQIVYNASESDYFRMGPLWFTSLVVLLEVPGRFMLVTDEVKSDEAEEETKSCFTLPA